MYWVEPKVAENGLQELVGHVDYIVQVIVIDYC